MLGPTQCALVLQEHYPWFLPTYLSYTYNIQRVDVLRYFILHHHGGIYIDLDMGCLKRLDFMRKANFTAPMTHPVGISNDVLAAAPGAPYLQRAIHRLRHSNRHQIHPGGCWRGAAGWRLWWVRRSTIKMIGRSLVPGLAGPLKQQACRVLAGYRTESLLRLVGSVLLLDWVQLFAHTSNAFVVLEHAVIPLSLNPCLALLAVQVMFSTGPMFLTVQYSLYPHRQDVAIISRPDYGKYDTSGDPFFYHLHGSSWHADDAAFIFWLDRHKLALVVAGSALAAGLASLAVVRWAVRHRYRQLPKGEE